MKRIKILLTVFAVAVISVTGYNAYDSYTMSETEKLVLENIEAITSTEYEHLLDCNTMCFYRYNWLCTIEVRGSDGELLGSDVCDDMYPR